jgi:flagellar protein FlgJ
MVNMSNALNMMNIQSHINTPSADEVRRNLSPIDSATALGMSAEELQAVHYAAETFESYFIQIMLREMRRTIPDEGGLIPKSQAERIFTEMLDEEKSKEMARAGGIGLADVIVRQMTRDSYSRNMR